MKVNSRQLMLTVGTVDIGKRGQKTKSITFEVNANGIPVGTYHDRFHLVGGMRGVMCMNGYDGQYAALNSAVINALISMGVPRPEVRVALQFLGNKLARRWSGDLAPSEPIVRVIDVSMPSDSPQSVAQTRTNVPMEVQSPKAGPGTIDLRLENVRVGRRGTKTKEIVLTIIIDREVWATYTDKIVWAGDRWILCGDGLRRDRVASPLTQLEEARRGRGTDDERNYALARAQGYRPLDTAP